MSNGKNQIDSINWMAVFSFSHIFKSFRIAIHPSKILLGLAAVVSIYLAGRVLDGVWGFCGQRVPDNDIVAYVCSSSPAYEQAMEKWTDGKTAAALRLKYKYRQERHDLTSFAADPGLGSDLSTAIRARITKYNEAEKETYDPAKIAEQREIDEKEDDWGGLLGDAGDEVDKIRDKIAAVLDSAYEDAEKAIGDAAITDEAKDKRTEALEEGYDHAGRASVRIAATFANEVERIRGKLVFESFLAYENQCLANALRAVRYGNFTTGLDDYEDIINSKAIPSLVGARPAAAIPNIRRAEADDPAGFLFWMLMACQGLVWLLCEHWLFALIFLTFSLGAWALFGGAMHRIAALHAAREEKISMVQALRFSSGKFLSFFTAPLIPLIIIFTLGFLLFLGGLLFGNVGGWLSWIMGVLFLIAIVLGLLISFLSIGLGGGCGLMYPTIAVEGSDAFDAISRSFSYVFARPWRTGLYGLIALVYGTICYLFVRLFAFIALAATHWFVKGGVFGGGGDLAANADYMDKLWPAPTFSDFHPAISWDALNGLEPLSAGLIAIWVYLVIGVVAAFGLSYLASSTTVIYYLLRRKVDATDLDDVYVEESEEELAGEVAEALSDQEPQADGEEVPAKSDDQPADEPSEDDQDDEPESSDESESKDD